MRIAISEISCTLPHPSLISNIYHKKRDQVKYVRIMVWGKVRPYHGMETLDTRLAPGFQG